MTMGGPLGGFDTIRQVVEKFGNTPIGLTTYFTDETRTSEAAAELDFGRSGNGEDCIAYLIYHCGAYYDTHGPLMMLSLLGCDPEIAGKAYCESLGYEVEHAVWGEDDEIPEDSYCYQRELDREKIEDRHQKTILIPAQWNWVRRI